MTMMSTKTYQLGARPEVGVKPNWQEHVNVRFETVDDSSYASSRSLNQYSAMSDNSGSQFKVSEIVNPDGSATIRSLLINEDGLWTKQEEEIDTAQFERIHRGRGASATNRDNSFEDDIAYLTSELALEYRPEAIAHRLRRQRLAQSSLLADVSTNSLFADISTDSPGRYSPNRPAHEGETSMPSLSPITRTTKSSMSPSRLGQPGSKNRGNSPKHVAFSEPLSSAESQSRADRMSSSDNSKKVNSDLYHLMGNNPYITDIYNDVDPTAHLAIKTSYSSDSSIFDDVAQTSYVDRVLGKLEDSKVRQGASPKKQNRISHVDDKDETFVPNLYSVSVDKTSSSDKIGIYVHLQNFTYGKRLVVSKVAPDGKFGNTRIKEGDVVVSINGNDMTEDPDLQQALNIVSSAVGTVTILVHKDIEVNDGQSVTQTTISSISKDVSSIANDKDHATKDNKTQPLFRRMEKVVSFEEDFNDRFAAKDVAKRGRMTGDGSMLISKDSEIPEPISIKMNESWKLSGVIVVNIEKKSFMSEKPGLSFARKQKEGSLEQVINISHISSSSVFAKTPLGVGDIIISINGFGLYDNADVFDAYKALGKPGKRLTIVAKKGEESLNDFLIDGRDFPQDKLRRVESTNTALTSQTSGTSGSTGSGKSPRNDGTSVKSTEREATRETLRGDGNTDENPPERITSHTNDFEFNEGSYSESVQADLLEAKSEKTEASDDTDSRGPISSSGNELNMFKELEENEKHSSMNTSTSTQGEESKNDVPTKSSQEDGEEPKRKVKKRQKVLITVTKEYKGQKIGIDFAMLNNKLVVTEVSPKGLLRNAPLVFGDTILSINGVSFRQDPDAKEAYSLIKKAPEKVTIEILKTEYAHDRGNSGASTKSCIPTTLFCRRKKSDHKTHFTEL